MALHVADEVLGGSELERVGIASVVIEYGNKLIAVAAGGIESRDYIRAIIRR